MLINLKVKTLDARTHDFSIDNELTIRQFKDQIAVKTNIAAENQRIIYQGRVLADDKQVKEYDVDGKVLHVAERPPFSQRGANATNNDEPMRNFRNMPGGRPRNMRNSPYFRALDGMLVGTMAIPVNNGNLTAAGTRTPPNRFPNSSSFCINRITVAQHMIDCANNIAAYLENPEIGLNNQPLDILQRGHWTMESTVVEVGVSTDMPRNNNIIDMVQDAVSAALSRNASGRNYTVVQLPTVYTNEGGAENSQQPQQSRDGGNEANSAEVGAASGTARSSESSEETTAAAAAVIIEDVTVTDEDERSASPQSSEDAGGAGAETDGAMGGAAAPAAAGAADDASNVNVTGVDSRRRTRPQVLATVIQRYRMVETRLAPFIDRYHEILQQDPEFADQDNVGRENAQRTFDRVSEALHYLSHAQHAISDLMLDMSQPGPRVLTCRPILVEQSGYIRSNNIFTPNIVAAPFTELMPQVPALAHAIPPPANAAATNTAATNAAATNVAATNAAATNVAATNAAAGPSVPNVDAAAATTQAEQQAANLLNIDQLIESIATERDGWMRGSAAPGTAPAPVGTQRTQTPSRPAAATPGFHATAVPVLSYQSTPVGTPPVGQAPNATHDELLEEVEGDERMLADAAAALVAGLGQHRAEDVEDPVDEPMVAPPSASGTQSQPQEQQQQQGQQQQGQQQQSPNENMEQTIDTSEEAPRPRFRVYVPVPLPPPNPYMRIARLIQAVANSATNDADLRLEFNMPNVINLPVHVITAALHPPAAGNTGTETATGTATAAAGAASESTTSATASAPTATVLNAVAASTSSGTRSGDQRANTLPTTATQTRSTARPQIQIGGNNNWAGRIAPTHTAFDRFLPCNSHHIREVEPPLVQQQQPTTTTQTNNNNTSNNNNISSSSSATNTIGSSGNNNRRGASNPTNYAIGLGGTSAFNAAAAAVTATAAAADAVITAATAVGVNTAAASTNAAVAADGNGTTLSVTVGNNSNNTTETSSGSQASRNLRAQVRSFLHQTVFEGGPINALTIPTAIDRALEWFADSLLYLRQYERPEYNSHDSVCNMLRRSLRLIIALCNDPSHCNVHFEHRLKQICEQFRLRLYSVLFLCLGSANAELFWRQLMRLLCVPLRSNFRNEALQFLCIYIDPTIPAQADTADAQQFLVLRNPEQAPQPTDDDLQQEQEQQPTESEQQSLDNDIEMAEVASSSNSSSAIEMEPALPAVTPGSEPWHNSFPNDWLPVITRDLQTQTEQDRPQPPYSDAYISGMSAKRRKIIQTEKPPTNVECLIASGVQRAMQRSGLSGTASNPAVNPDVVVNAIAHDAIVQASYTDAVRMNARERVKQDVDYQPSKYPQIAKFTELK